MPRPKGKWQNTGRACSVCRHEQRGRIDYLLVTCAGETGSGRRGLAAKFGLSESAIYNHGKRHISAEYHATVLAGPFRSEEDLRELVAEEGISVLQNYRGLFNAHRARWLAALERGDDSAMISHARAMTDMLWKMGQLTREIAPAQTMVVNNAIQIFEHPEYIGAITALSVALRPYPEARQAAAAALRSLSAKSAAPLIAAPPAA
jgi:hypothetical protein